jgi:hypothetical protein
MSEFFGRLETELRAAAERPPRRTLPISAIAVAGLLALALAPIVFVLGSGNDQGAPDREAASDAPPPAPRVRVDHRGVRYEPPGATVLATGTSPVSGPWQLQTYVQTYEQEEGGRCIGVSLPHADPQDEVTWSGICPHPGGPPLPVFIAQAIGVPPTPDQKEFLVYGRAPEEAVAVELVRDGEVAVRVGTSDGPDGVDGDFYVLTLPPDLELDGVMRWIGEDGRAGEEVRFRLP